MLSNWPFPRHPKIKLNQEARDGASGWQAT